MKKTILSMLVMGVASVAQASFTDATWTFENTLAPETTSSISGLTNVAKVTSGGQTTDISDTSSLFVESGVLKGSEKGNYVLDSDLGKALTLSSGQFVFVGGNAYWSNGAGKLMLGSSATNDFTVSAWINPTSVTGEHFFFSTGNANSSGIAVSVINGALTLTSKGKFHYSNFTGVEGASNTITAGEWTHVAITYNHTDGVATAYINGESIGTISGLNNVAFTDAGGAAAAIGSLQNASCLNGYVGQLAEFGIYDGAYSQEQVLAVAHLSSTPEPATGTLSLLALAGLCVRRRRK